MEIPDTLSTSEKWEEDSFCYAQPLQHSHGLIFGILRLVVVPSDPFHSFALLTVADNEKIENFLNWPVS